MTSKQIAQLIPANYREEILQLNMIQTAQPVFQDAATTYLATIWKNYVAPAEDITCPLCLTRILKNYKELLPEFIELEKQKRLLKGL